MFDRAAIVGHRFDKDTPISETVRGFTSEVDGITSLTCLALRCKRFMMSFKLATYATSECLLAGHGSVCFSFMSRSPFIKCTICILHSPCNAK